jgi:hypothetical protein
MTTGPLAEDVVRAIIRWAATRIPIRAVLLTSTRAIPDAPVDALSDYRSLPHPRFPPGWTPAIEFCSTKTT